VFLILYVERFQKAFYVPDGFLARIGKEPRGEYLIRNEKPGALRIRPYS